ncbi:hypothetical protein J6590_104741, partial [Homalodisca vitripennis]
LYEAPKENVQWCKIGRRRWLLDRAIPLNPSSGVILVQEIMHRSPKVCRSSVVLKQPLSSVPIFKSYAAARVLVEGLPLNRTKTSLLIHPEMKIMFMKGATRRPRLP